jgi:hypothetical protein
MRPTRGARALLMLVLLTLLGAPVALGAMATAADASVPSMESQLLALTNSDRARAGLAPLSSSSTLVSIARSWSAHMASTGQLAHDPSLASKVSGWSSLGENIGYAYSASQAESMFMNSAPHRANILKASYNRVGIGISRDAKGTYWFTIDFEQTSGSRPTPVSHTTTHKTTHKTTSSARTTRATRASRSAVRPPLGRAPVVVPALAPLTATATGRLDLRLSEIDQRLSSRPVALPVPRPDFQGPDPTRVAVIVTGGLLVTALAGFATTRPPRVRVRGLPGSR